MSGNDELDRREQCPKCRAKGRDNNKDNLAVYKDGHAHCFSCGHHVNPPMTQEAIKNKLLPNLPPENNDAKCSYLPFDISADLPDSIKKYLMQYHLIPSEFTNFWWSNNTQQLIYPVFDDDGYLVFWSARNFSKDRKTKYYNSGSPEHHFKILGRENAPLILVEDVISAIRVARHFKSMPLFGSHISTQMMVRLRDHVLPFINPLYKDEIGVWLDPNKKTESLQFVKMMSEFGLKAYTIFSDNDPKLCYPTEIVYNVTVARRERLGHA